MSADFKTEQIGLAISKDGLKFTRINNDGLILPVDSKSDWMSSMTCNPIVLRINSGKFIMFFQGIVNEPRKTTIGLSESLDGINWAKPVPIISVKDKQVKKKLETEKFQTVDLIEPTVIFEDNLYKMWFISQGKLEKNNRLHFAQSKDLKSWDIIKTDILKNQIETNLKIFYPEIKKSENGNYSLYLTLRNNSRLYHYINEYISQDGINFSFNKKLLPNRFTLKSLDIAKIIKIPKIRGLVSILFDLSLKTISHRNFFGYAHSSFLKINNINRLYYHGYHFKKVNTLYMDIGKFDLVNEKLINQQNVFLRSNNLNSWDSGFVADPFLIQF